nr:helix-turn-helix domain-containing protein [Chelonobacter oris]
MMIPTVALVAYPDFSPFLFSVPYMIFGEEMLPGQKLFDLLTVSPSSELSCVGNGLNLQAKCGPEALQNADIIIIPGWHNIDETPSNDFLLALQQAYQRGAHLVGLCLGTYVLAYAGLLDGKKAATHWEAEADFSRRFPQVRLDANALYVEEQRILTSAGTGAGLDCCLHLVREYHGSRTANKIARRMVIAPHRDGGQAQFIERPLPQSTQDVQINQLLAYLRENPTQSHSLEQLAQRAAMSRRTFTRHFHKATGMSVGEWLLAERLQRVQLLLETTALSIEQVAEQAGFNSGSSLRDHFKRRFNLSPTAWRKIFGLRSA